MMKGFVGVIIFGCMMVVSGMNPKRRPNSNPRNDLRRRASPASTGNGPSARPSDYSNGCGYGYEGQLEQEGDESYFSQLVEDDDEGKGKMKESALNTYGFGTYEDPMAKYGIDKAGMERVFKAKRRPKNPTLRCYVDEVPASPHTPQFARFSELAHAVQSADDHAGLATLRAYLLSDTFQPAYFRGIIFQMCPLYKPVILQTLLGLDKFRPRKHDRQNPKDLAWMDIHKAYLLICRWMMKEHLFVLLKRVRLDYSYGRNEVFRMLVAQDQTTALKMILEMAGTDKKTRMSNRIIDCARFKRSLALDYLLHYTKGNPAARSNRALLLTCLQDYPVIAKQLLETGRVDPAKNNNEAMRVACEAGHARMIELLMGQPNVAGTVLIDNMLGAMLKYNRHETFRKFCIKHGLTKIKAIASLPYPEMAGLPIILKHDLQNAFLDALPKIPQLNMYNLLGVAVKSQSWKIAKIIIATCCPTVIGSAKLAPLIRDALNLSLLPPSNLAGLLHDRLDFPSIFRACRGATNYAAFVRELASTAQQWNAHGLPVAKMAISEEFGWVGRSSDK